MAEKYFPGKIVSRYLMIGAGPIFSEEPRNLDRSGMSEERSVTALDKLNQMKNLLSGFWVGLITRKDARERLRTLATGILSSSESERAEAADVLHAEINAPRILDRTLAEQVLRQLTEVKKALAAENTGRRMV